MISETILFGPRKDNTGQRAFVFFHLSGSFHKSCDQVYICSTDLFLPILNTSHLHRPIPTPGSPISYIYLTLPLLTTAKMYTVNPDDVLVVRGANPRTGRISPFKVVDDDDYCQCIRHHSHPQLRDDNSSTFTYFSDSTRSRSTSYGSALSHSLPPVDFPHPSEFSDPKCSYRRNVFQCLLAKLGYRRRAAKPMGQGVRLRSALSK